MNKNFGLIGIAGYVAPRHLKAIKENKCNLIVALDKNDSVGIIDSYFPDTLFFTETERFDRYVHKISLDDKEKRLDYISICSPNHLHDAHIRLALRSGCDVICEKPLVLNSWNLDALSALEKETKNKINSILQLRLHPKIIELKRNVELAKSTKKYDVDLTYVTSRGKWYFQSWKGEIEKSGGIATNIGIHFFDMLTFIFGKLLNSKVFLNENSKASGFLEFENARVRWYLSLDFNDVPENLKKEGITTFRSVNYNGKSLEFSGGFVDLHTLSYKNVLEGKGFGIEDSRHAIEIASSIRDSEIYNKHSNDKHPWINKTKRFK